MAIYRLWRQSDNRTFADIEARNAEHAVAVFGEKLGATLTLEEGQAAPQYMLAQIDKSVSFTTPPGILVWVST